MRTKLFSVPTVIIAVFFVLFASCKTQNSHTAQLPYDVDSIKVKISYPANTRSILISASDKAVVSKGNEKTLLDAKQTKRLKAMSNKLFIEKSEKIILSEKPANGRTDHPIFTVTLYRGNMANSLRYEMGEEVNGVTHCTNKDIRYSKSFREFMFNAFKFTK